MLSDRRFLAPLIAETRRRIAGDRIAVAEPGSIERKTGNFALARTTFLETFEPDGITEAHDIQAHVAPRIVFVADATVARPVPRNARE